MNTKDIENVYPLSPMQQGMLYHFAYEPGSEAYFARVAFVLDGELDGPALERAWQQVVNNCALLRTSFAWKLLTSPLQVVHRQVKLPFNYVDWCDLNSREQEDRLEEFNRTDQQRGLDLSQPPLMRITLIRIAKDVHHFIWSFHHILVDGWSVPLLLDEAFSYYEAYRHQQELNLPAKRPFRDYIHWLQQQDLTRAETFWRQYLKGFTSPTALPGHFAGRNELLPIQQATQERELDGPSTQALQGMARRQQLTLNTIVLGAWALLLSRYSGEQDVVFGATVSGRPAELAGVETMLGLFINTLPVRVKVEGDARVVDWLKRLQAEQVELRQYEYSPLVDVQGWSEVARGTGMFSSMLVFDNYPAEALATGKRREAKGAANGHQHLKVGRLQSFEQSNYPLALVSGARDKVLLKIEYDKARIPDEIVTRMLEHLEVMLERMAGDVEQRVGAIGLLTAGERAELEEWNGTEQEYPGASSVPELFEQQVLRTPEAIAVRYQEQELSYAELNGRANQLAHHLIAVGVTTETRVGLCVERSLEMVVALLGILKAGAAYVPLDPEYPQARLAFMMADAEVSVLLTQESLRWQLPEHDLPVLCLDRDWPQIAAESRANPGCEVRAANLAYLIYTSGSTGQPKGVAITHQAINRLIFNSGYVSLGSTDVVGQAANASFDAITFEVWGALLCGARLQVIGQEQLLAPARLARVLQQEQVTVLFLTTALLNQMGRQEPGGFGGVQQLLFGGQQVAPQWVRAVMGSGYQGRLVHVYGPTETTTFATWHEVREVGEAAVTIPIGRALGNTQVYILDSRMELVPVGVRGELYIGGAGLARGYWQRAELTAERFLPHPFSAVAGARLYRTGDLVRYRGDGEIEFLGRLDEQVKVRGYRIELGEIESVLNRHGAVAECAVVAASDGEDGEQRLLAYVVMSSEAEQPSGGELRQYLQAQLPEYMIPAQFVLLEELPLTPNGKVDRRALPAPEQSRPELEAGYIAPRTAAEEILAGIFQRVLAVERVGIHDNFFELGGHSLKITQMISIIHKEHNALITVRDLFTSPTVAALAEIFSKTEKSNHAAVKKLAEHSYYDLSYAQKQMWISCQIAENSTPYNVPVAYTFTGEMNIGAFERALEAIVERHESLRTTFVLVGDEPKQKIHDHIAFKLIFMDFSEDGNKDAIVRRIADGEAASAFNLETGSLLRAVLVKLEQTKHVFLLTMHHIITDGWSVNILMKELMTLYGAFSKGEENPLTPLRIQYKDYVRWQEQLLNDKSMEDQESYWLAQLGGRLPVLNLPTDHPRPAVKTFNGDISLFSIDKYLTSRLYQISNENGATLFMTLLAAMYALLYRYTGQTDIVMGSPISGRNHSDLEDQIGLYLNMLALRVNVNGDQSFKRLLEATRHTTLGAYEHQQYQLDLLLAKLNPQRDAGRMALFNAGITLQNHNSAQPPGKTDLNISRFKQSVKTAEYDLWFLFTETGDEILVTINHNTDLFEQRTINAMWLKLSRLIEQVVSDQETLIMDMKLDSLEDEFSDGEEILIELGV